MMPRLETVEKGHAANWATGKGAAWGNSLFEDNAEYGLGQAKPLLERQLRDKVEAALARAGKSMSIALRSASGYWPLYRFNPKLSREGRNPFILDSKKVTGDEAWFAVMKFLNRQNRYAQLVRSSPVVAEKLQSELQAPEAACTGAVCVVMCSTCGHGDFPQNSGLFWSNLSAQNLANKAGNMLDLFGQGRPSRSFCADLARFANNSEAKAGFRRSRAQHVENALYTFHDFYVYIYTYTFCIYIYKFMFIVYILIVSCLCISWCTSLLRSILNPFLLGILFGYCFYDYQ
eukprot:Skav204428  [mRNA]  locus=scaffold3703:94686:108320:+ [translate_table: standard]